MNIKFANGKELPIIMCYSNGKKIISGETRSTREIVLSSDVIGLSELKALLTNKTNLSVIEVTIEYTDETGELKTDTEVLENFVYAAEIKDKMNGEVWFTIGQKTEMEIENEEAMRVIDELLIAMEA